MSHLNFNYQLTVDIKNPKIILRIFVFLLLINLNKLSGNYLFDDGIVVEINEVVLR
jgi:hypothetical protein